MHPHLQMQSKRHTQRAVNAALDGNNCCQPCAPHTPFLRLGRNTANAASEAHSCINQREMGHAARTTLGRCICLQGLHVAQCFSTNKVWGSPVKTIQRHGVLEARQQPAAAATLATAVTLATAGLPATSAFGVAHTRAICLADCGPIET
jgi:hypothetical protein